MSGKQYHAQSVLYKTQGAEVATSAVVFALFALAAILCFLVVDQRKEDRRSEGGPIRVIVAEDGRDGRG